MTPFLSRLLPELARQLLLVLGIALIFAVGFTLARQQDFGVTLVYSLCITACCSASSQGFHTGVSRLLGGKRLRGLPLTLVIVFGAMPGYQLGYWIGDALTGNRSQLLFEASPRQLLLFLFLLALPCIAVSYYFRSREQLAQAKAQAAEHQLQLLQAQLEPHMLFNTLANLRVLIGMDPARAQAMLDQLIAFLRATLQASRSGSHSLADEFARLGDYLALMQVRMQERLRPVLDLPPELAQAQVPPLLLQPLVENAIKHGLEPALQGGELRISARREGTQLLLEVADSGVGLGQNGSTGTQFGLHQIRERLATRYGAAASLSLSANPTGGAIATITLPLP
ncbi:MAG TPA: histidine kinase [Burkholderiaceae bacterium]